MANSIDKQVGNRVRTAWQAVGMSQSKLADSIGLTFQQIQKYEKGSNRISASRLQQFSNILGVPIPYFFQDSASSTSQRKMKSEDLAITHVSEFVSSADGQALMKAYIKIRDAKLRQAVTAFVGALAAR